jgi:hypothetical protein
MTEELAVFRHELAKRAMQGCWRAVYGTEDIEPTAASLKFIDRVIDLKSDEFSSVFLRRLRFEDGRRPIAL